jgi:hypothetical protein
LGPFDSVVHLLSFAAPALVVALLASLAARWLLPRGSQGLGWRGRFALGFIAGLATQVAGLWLFGRDGKMVTYGALVLVVATTEWLAGRGWRS